MLFIGVVHLLQEEQPVKKHVMKNMKVKKNKKKEKAKKHSGGTSSMGSMGSAGNMDRMDDGIKDALISVFFNVNTPGAFFCVYVYSREGFMMSGGYGGGKRQHEEEFDVKDRIEVMVRKFEQNRADAHGIVVKQDVIDNAIAKASLLMSNLENYKFAGVVRGLDAKQFEELTTFIKDGFKQRCI